MMLALLQLPDRKDTDALLTALDDIVAAAHKERSARQVDWWVTEGYIRGVRDFFDIDYDRGEVSTSYETVDGELHLRWEEPMTKFQIEVGRLSRLDMSPKADKRVNSLESLRNASLCQFLLSNALPAEQIEQFKVLLLTGTALYGTYGIAAWPITHAGSLLTDFHFELVPPWELLPIPAGTTNRSDLRGLCRSRLFPFQELKLKSGMPDINSADWDMIDLPYGTDLCNIRLTEPAAQGVSAPLFDRPAQKKEKQDRQTRNQKVNEQSQYFVRLREFWIYGPKGDLTRYIRRAGRVILEDTDYTREDIPVPARIGIVRHEDTGHFYGRSLASKLLPLGLELEHLLEKVIQNMADADRFGYVDVPMGMGYVLEQFKSTETPRIITHEGDLGTGAEGVKHIEPVPLTDIPARVMKFGLDLLDRVVAQGPLYSGSAPGRSDSGRSFSILGEMGSTHLIPTAINLEAGLVTVFRSMLHDMRRRLRQEGSVELPLSNISNELAGITVDASTGMAVITSNVMPDPWQVSLSIASRDATSGDRRRNEALGFLQNGILTRTEFIVMNYKENWGYPVGNRNIWENYIKAAMLNLILFNDGQTPGDLPNKSEALPMGEYFNEVVDMPEVHLLALEDFTSGSAFMLASTDVRDAFNEKIQELRSRTGGGPLPAGLAPMESAAMQGIPNLPMMKGNMNATA